MQRWRVYLEQFMPDMRVVKSPALKPYVGLITFSAASVAIALGITLQKYVTFEYHSNAGVVGWLSANAYPKQQEYFFYLLALLGVPITICLYWLGWSVYSRWCAKRTAQPIARVLKANALASIPLWLCWLQVYHIGQGILIGLLLPISISILLKLALLYLRYFPTLWNSNVSDDTDGIRIKSPIIGTAYLAPEPGGKKFVNVGDKIKKGQTIMIVEAMKTMNHVPSSSNGEVKKILVEDGQPVEFGQTLVLLK